MLKVSQMESGGDDGDGNVVSIFDRGPRRNSRFSGILTSPNSEFQGLVESYLDEFGSQRPDNERIAHQLGIAIMKYATSDEADLLIKFAILEMSLGYGSSAVNYRITHQNLMCIFFKKSMIDFMDDQITPRL